jgi:hypothetical protein
VHAPDNASWHGGRLDDDDDGDGNDDDDDDTAVTSSTLVSLSCTPFACRMVLESVKAATEEGAVEAAASRRPREAAVAAVAVVAVVRIVKILLFRSCSSKGSFGILDL